MKKNIIKYILGLFIAAAIAAPASSMAQGKIATADLRRLFDNYYKTKQADAALKEEGAEIEKERKSMLDNYQKVKEEYNTLIDKANDQAISSQERDRSKQSAEKKVNELRDFEQSYDRFMRAASDKLREKEDMTRKKIVNEICGVVEAKAKAAGYSLVIDSAAETVNRTPVFLYNNGENDITDVVLSQLNAGASTVTPKPETLTLDSKTDSKKTNAVPEKKK